MVTVVFDEPNGFDALYTTELPSPEPAEGQVAVRITAATINPVDVGVVAGGMGTDLPGEAPRAVGWDGAGTVHAVGPKVDPSLVGKQVLVFSNWLEDGRGLQRDHAIVRKDQVVEVEAGLSDVDLASLGLNGMTALEVVHEAGLAPGDTLAVAGARGDVGRLIVAIAEHRGLATVAIGRDATDAELEEIGARVLIGAAPADARWLKAVRDGGRLISLNHKLPSERGINTDPFFVHRDGAAMKELAELIASGVLRPNVGATFPAEQAAEAYRQFVSGLPGHARVVITFD